jgi:methylated-DNA-[protein]-cysteine S-methyltransferase
MDARQITVPSPVGSLVVSEHDDKIVAIDWGRATLDAETPLLVAAAQQLNAYFYCELQRFDLPLAPAGTPFQRAAWQAMLEIPYGQTRSYGELARRLASVPRAIGGACGRNPIPIVIPCHRVLAGGGRIGGYSGAGGADTKRFLLQLEGAPCHP